MGLIAPLRADPVNYAWIAYFHRPNGSGRFTVYAPDQAAAEAEACRLLALGDVLERVEAGGSR